jgi:esterase
MQLHFKEFGRGKPLILLHGLFGSSDNWLGIAPKLAEKFQVLAPDLRNHGQSPHSDEMNYALMAGDVAEFLGARNLESANVLGHSLGGKVAMQFALQFSARVEKLIVVDMAPRAYAPEHDEIFAALLALNLENFSSRTEMEIALAENVPSLNLRRFLLKNLRRNAGGKFFWKMNLRGLFENYPKLGEAIPSAKPFEKPALFLRAGKSDYVRESDFARIHELFPRAEIQTIAGAGHWLHADAPGEFTSHVLKFLQTA